MILEFLALFSLIFMFHFLLDVLYIVMTFFHFFLLIITGFFRIILYHQEFGLTMAVCVCVCVCVCLH
jgi:hypothetical protein